MNQPEFTVVLTPDGEGVTYSCGCPCAPTARPTDDGSSGHEHCCCGKVHFVGVNAVPDLKAYLASRKTTRKREPDYDFGEATVLLGGTEIPVAWAFPLT